MLPAPRRGLSTVAPLILAAGLSAPLTLAPHAMAVSDLPIPAQGGPAELLRYTGDPSSATGSALSNGECDVNGDSFSDAVVGAWFWDKAPLNNIGAAYVLFGSPQAEGGSLADPAEVGAVRLDGPAEAGATVAFAVACAGDVNNDGFDDIAIGHYGAQRTYVVFGAKDFQGLTLDAMGDRGFVVKGGPASGNVGFSMAPVGDLNADGYDDFAVAEVGADTLGRTNNGRIWVVAGRDDISDVDLLAPAAGQVLMTVDGALSEERIGQIAKAGDVNGDDIDDFVMGAYTSTPWGAAAPAAGAAYVVFGGTTGPIDAANLGTVGYTIAGPQRGRDRLGISVSAAGDVNADGRDDLLIGADGVNNAVTGPRNGGAAVVWGSTETRTVYTDPTAVAGQSVFTCPDGEPAATCPSPQRRGYWIDGAANSDSTGYSLAGIGDVNGDTTPDFALGAWGYDVAGDAGAISNAGAVHVVFGDASTVTGSVTDPSAGYRIDGNAAGDRFGRQVGLIGDVDDNGTRDFYVGADFAARPLAQSGEVTIALLGKLATSVALSAPSTAAPGEPIRIDAEVTKLVGGRTPVTAGTVEVRYDGNPLAGCTALPVIDGAVSCEAVLPAEGAGELSASFSGTDYLSASTSAGAPLAVARDLTTTSLVISTADPAPGQLVRLVAKVVEGSTAAESGTVSFATTDGPLPECDAVPLTSGEAFCLVTWPTRGDHAVNAAYSGTTSLAPSSSGVTTVAVGTPATLVLDGLARRTYGTPAPALTGVISGGNASGQVTASVDGRVLATGDVTADAFALDVGHTALAPGSWTVKIAYAGNARLKAASRTVSVTVDKARSVIGAKASKRTIRPGKRKVRITARVSAIGVSPTGVVEFKIRKRLITRRLSGGVATLRVPKSLLRKPGRVKVKVRYLGSDTVATATGKTTLKVVR